MPRLLLFAPCQKLIFSQEDNSASLISLLQGMKVGVPPEAPVPDGTFIPMVWYAIALWYREPDDGGGTFEQYITMTAPDGTELLRGDTSNFTMTRAPHHRVYTRVISLPIWTPGECAVNLYFRREGAEWAQMFSYPVRIEHTTPEEVEPSMVNI